MYQCPSKSSKTVNNVRWINLHKTSRFGIDFFLRVSYKLFYRAHNRIFNLLKIVSAPGIPFIKRRSALFPSFE